MNTVVVVPTDAGDPTGGRRGVDCGQDGILELSEEGDSARLARANEQRNRTRSDG
jgi:hypothetical protein